MDSVARRHAVILSGGGANGAYEIGVLKALFEGSCPAVKGSPLDPFLYCGTSVGSYNAAAAVAVSSECEGCGIPAALEGLWLDRVAENPARGGNGVYRMRGDPRRVLDPRFLAASPSGPLSLISDDTRFLARDLFDRAGNFVLSSEPLDRRAIESINLSSLVSAEPLERLIRETISLEAIRRSPKQLCVAATDWVTGKLRLFGNADMTDAVGHQAILASCAIPVFFPVVEVGGGHFVDGGVVLNTPLAPALEMGADVLHVIYLDPDVENIPFGGLQNSMDTLCRMLVIMMAQHLNRDIEAAEAFNRILEASQSESGSSPIPSDAFHRAARLLGRLGKESPQNRVTVHRYRPAKVLSALSGILKFGRDRLAKLVEEGYQDALRHDCAASGCVAV